MRIETEVKLDFKDVLIRPKRSTLRSRAEVSLERTYVCKHSKQTWKGVPIVVSNMDTTGTFEMALVAARFGVLTCLHKHYTPEQIVAFAKAHPAIFANNVAVSAGTSERDFETVQAVHKAVGELRMICLDVANGYSEHFIEAVKRYRAAFPRCTIVAGNVVTGEMTEELILSGADIVKIGIGPGSVCTTRAQTGVVCSAVALLETAALGSDCVWARQGYPQLSAVIECSDAAHGLGGLVMSDGGCALPGDFAKAFGAGADFVMSGSMFAAHDESGGDLVVRDGKRFKVFYGMSSTTAMEKHGGSVAEYRSSEGKTVEVPYKGPVEGTIQDIQGGLRSACTYVGASSLKEISKRTTFIRVTQQLNPVYASARDESRLPASYFTALGQGEDVKKRAKTEA
jgi:GMP reductase